MGLTVTRLVSRLDERVTFPAIDPKFPFRRPSIGAGRRRCAACAARTPLYVTPYALGGGDATYCRSTGGSVPPRARRPPGGRRRRPLSALRQPDAGPDREHRLRAGRGGRPAGRARSLPAVLPRAAPLLPGGQQHLRLRRRRRHAAVSFAPDRPDAGPRAGARSSAAPAWSARAGAWDVGAARDADRRQGDAPGENFGVLRLRRPVLNPWSTAGLMVTTYYGGGRHNIALGADTSLRVHGDEYVGLKWAATVDDSERDERRPRRAAASSTRSGSGARRRGLSLHLAVHAGRGRLPAGARVHAAPRLHHREHRRQLVHLHRQRTNTSGASTRARSRSRRSATRDRVLESGQYAFWVQWDTKAGGGGWIEPKWFHENVLVPFTIGNSGARFPPGATTSPICRSSTRCRAAQKLRTDVDFRTGTYFDGTRTQVILTPTWNRRTATSSSGRRLPVDAAALRAARRTREHPPARACASARR